MADTQSGPVSPERLREVIDGINAAAEPEVILLKRSRTAGPRLGVFASSFNPVTIAHIELMAQAAERFHLDEMLALAGRSNADKRTYDCSLEDRIAMLMLALENDRKTSIGVSSHPYFADMARALSRVYSDRTELHFILGFDTFERVLDTDSMYLAEYHQRFKDRRDALEYLAARSCLIVAGRGDAGLEDHRALLAREPAALRGRAFYFDLPAGLRSRSASEVRSRLAEGLSVRGLVPDPVERFINERRIYRGSA